VFKNFPIMPFQIIKDNTVIMGAGIVHNDHRVLYIVFNELWSEFLNQKSSKSISVSPSPRISYAMTLWLCVASIIMTFQFLIVWRGCDGLRLAKFLKNQIIFF
jgi:hypothetical protein